jgi:hypothetical protein
MRDIVHSDSIACALQRGAEGRKGDAFGPIFLVGSLLLCAASSVLYSFCREYAHNIRNMYVFEIVKFEDANRGMKLAMLRLPEPRGDEKTSCFPPSSPLCLFFPSFVEDSHLKMYIRIMRALYVVFDTALGRQQP